MVEDDPSQRRLLQRVLETEYEVLVAGEGSEAVRLAQTQRPGLIFLDIGLPRLDGLNTLRLLKTNAQTAEIPVVIQSAHGESSSLLEAQMLGAIDFLIKPYGVDEVQDMVLRYMVIWPEPR